MIRTKAKELKVAHVYVCDDCKTEYILQNTDHIFEIQEFLNIEFVGGYGSVFGDGALVKCNLCQTCVQKRLGDVLQIEIMALEVEV
ncbi:MAG: hypothetical protein B7C24_10165 [Bacteroidetes bacterium 4572_77]|nr:MAG: hypothetical protein B7C24_10165 [Bacteroidetes bacterium 4572_77]